MLWIKEVELVESVDDLKSSRSIRGAHGLNFELLDARIASALNRIIQNTRFKKEGQSGGTKGPEAGPFPSRKTDCLLDLRVLPGHWNPWFRRELCRPIYSCSSKWWYSGIRFEWDGNLLSMTKTPSDDILEGSYKLRIRESEKPKTVLELYDLEIHQKKKGPDYHRLKTMVKRSIEQEIRNNNFGNRIGNFEKNAVVNNQGTKQRVQRILGDCWQWETNGQCVKGDNCNFRHDMDKRGKSTQPNPSPNSFMRQNGRNASRTRSPRGRSQSGRMSRWPCKDYLKRTCTNSFCGKWHPSACLFNKSKSVCKFGEKCSYAHRQVEEQPSKRSKKNGDSSAVAMLKITRQLGCVFHGYGAAEVFIDFTEELRHTETNRMCKIHKSRCTSRWHSRPKSFGPGEPFQRNPNAPKFEDRSQEQTEWQERCAREAAWRLAKSVLKLKEKNLSSILLTFGK